VAVIELDDKSHNSKKVKVRDEFLASACAGAELKLIRFRVRKSYKIIEVRETILNELGEIQNDVELGEIQNDVELVDELILQSGVDTVQDNHKLSTSKLAKKNGMNTNDFLEKMVTQGYLYIANEKFELTEKGRKSNVEFVEKFGGYYLWPANLLNK
jgi:hypothetical protein